MPASAPSSCGSAPAPPASPPSTRAAQTIRRVLMPREVINDARASAFPSCGVGPRHWAASGNGQACSGRRGRQPQPPRRLTAPPHDGRRPQRSPATATAAMPFAPCPRADCATDAVGHAPNQREAEAFVGIALGERADACLLVGGLPRAARASIRAFAEDEARHGGGSQWFPVAGAGNSRLWR